MHTQIIRPAALCAVLALGLAAWAQNAVLPAANFPLPEGTHSGSGYTAIETGLDGKVYVGTAWYGGSAHLVCLDPATGKWSDIIDAHKITRDTGTGLDSQSKFHAKILVGADGLIWAATKQGNEEFTYRPEYGENLTGFKGGHLFSYNPKTGQVIDHGILMAQEGVMGGAIDNARQRIYYVSDPKGHFLIYDIKTNAVRDLGSVGKAPRYMAIDAQGRVFCGGASLPGYAGSCMTMYDPATDKLYQLGVNVVGGDAQEYATPYVLVVSADGKKLFGAAMNKKFIQEYDLATVKLNAKSPYTNGTIDCRLAAEFKAGDTHAGTPGKDGSFYFNSGNLLYRYNSNTRAAEQLGVIEVPKMWQGVHSQGACFGPDGTLYMKFIYPYTVLAFDKLTAGGK